MTLWSVTLRLTGTVSRWLRFLVSWADPAAIVGGSPSEAGGSLLHGEDGIRRGLSCVRDGLIRVNDPVMPATV